MQSRYLLPEYRSVRFTVEPAVLPLLFVIGPNIVKRFSYDIDKSRVYLVICLFDLIFSDQDIVRTDMGSVKFLSV